MPWEPTTTDLNESTKSSKNTKKVLKTTQKKDLPSLVPIRGNAQPSNVTAQATGQLAPIASTSTNPAPDPTSDLNGEMMAAQIHINSKAMDEIDTLKAERQEILTNAARINKERDILKMQLNKMSDQLNFLKKKMKQQGQDENDRNAPNRQTQSD